MKITAAVTAFKPNARLEIIFYLPLGIVGKNNLCTFSIDNLHISKVNIQLVCFYVLFLIELLMQK